jgi:hypothetical protein
MTIGPPPICEGCTRRIVDSNAHVDDEVRYACEAFPRGIPQDIVLNQFDHRKRHDGDHGLRFEPITTAAANYARELFP